MTEKQKDELTDWQITPPPKKKKLGKKHSVEFSDQMTKKEEIIVWDKTEIYYDIWYPYYCNLAHTRAMYYNP